ncbi:MAG: 3-dehydroquinate synthase [Trueperaceae bacterium]|nr:3-dehydroquinate synthase [Trueperaceae bacterium]
MTTAATTSATTTVEVRVAPPYEVRIGPGVLAEAGEHLPGGRVALVSDAHVAPLYAAAVAERLEDDGRSVMRLVVPAGERSKSVAVWGDLLRALAGAGFGRDDAVLALGGGVVGDLAGFVAASYARGIAVVQAPTSLLAMADAAIGGKTGVNLPEGKNLVGAFWQPRSVLMDVSTLRTLPAEVFRHGSVEVFKHGLLADPELADAVLDGRLAQDAEPAEMTRWIAASARVKADVVGRDEREEGEARATLNLGHTVAHALEAVTEHALAHGEAVAWGLLYAAHLSRLDADARGRTGTDWTDRVRRLIETVRPAPPPELAWSELEPYLGLDKKNRAGRRRWILADAPGEARMASDVPPERELAAWTAFMHDVSALRPASTLGAVLPDERSDS